MWRILSSVNSQSKTKRRPTFLKYFPDNRIENSTFQGLSFPVSGLSFHILTLVYSSTHRVREFIYRHVVLHLLVLSLRCDIEYGRLEKLLGARVALSRDTPKSCPCYCGKCTMSWGERVSAETTLQI